MSSVHRIAPPTSPFDPSSPAPEQVVAGAPEFGAVNAYERGGVYAGVWSSSPGAWRVFYDEWEFCQVTQGLCEITPDSGAPVRYGVGEAFVIEPGFRGVFRVIEPLTKTYVILAPNTAAKALS
jgi:uncharacterized cupin superfamily protein